MAAYDTIESKKIPSLLNRRIDDNRYILVKRLGSGGYSVVYLAIDLVSPRRDNVAVKCLLQDTNAQKLKSYREIYLHKKASVLPGVAKLYHTVEEDGLLFLILEYIRDGDLFTAITEDKLFIGHDELIKTVFVQLLDTLQDLHQMGIYHRDLKPENVLVLKHSNSMKLFLTDFGLATDLELSKNFGCGSYFYMTPECLVGFCSNRIKGYSSRAADIWALGVILINMICSRSPWKCAVLTDPSFARYCRSRAWLRDMLPLSPGAFNFVDRIFSNHGNNLTLPDLRAEFVEIKTFYMTREELAKAHKTARLVAREWMPETPVDDIREADLAAMTKVDDISDADLFVDTPVKCNTTGSVSAPSTITAGSSRPLARALSLDLEFGDTLALSRLEEQPGSDRSSVVSLSRSDSSGSESDLPITPESKPVQATEDVPDMPEGETIGKKWDALDGKDSALDNALVAIEEGTANVAFVL